MVERKPKSGWGGARPNTGGARPGAGRKADPQTGKRVTISASVAPVTAQRLRRAARREGSVGRVLDRIVEHA